METAAVNLPEGYSLDSPGVPEGYTLDPTTSVLGAAGRGALDALPFGTKGAAAVEAGLGSGKYEDYLKELDSLLAADKEQHPIAHYGGEAAGTLAPLAIPGVGEALSAESLAGRAGIGAGIGALQAASNTRAPLMSTQGATDVALGAGTGAVLNPAVGALGDLFRKAGSSVASPILDEAGTDNVIHPSAPPVADASEGVTNIPPATMPTGQPSGAMNMAGTPPAQPENVLPASPNAVLTGNTGATAPNPEAGIQPSDSELKARMLTQVLGGTSRQLRNLPGQNPIQTLNKMGDVINENNLISPLDRYSTRLQKFVELHNQAGKVIGATVEQAQAAPIPAQPIIAKLSEGIKFPTPPQQAQLDSLAKQVASYADQSGNMTFQRLQQLKGDLGAQAFSGQGDPILQQAYHAVSNVQDAELNKISDMPGIDKAAFDKAKAAYQVTSRAIPMLRMATAKSLVNKPSLTELLSGHPLGALTKAVGEPAGRAMSAIGFKAASALEGTGGTAANIPTLLAHPAMAAYKNAFGQAVSGLTDQAEIQKKTAITDFVLSQRDPHYSEAKALASKGLGQ